MSDEPYADEEFESKKNEVKKQNKTEKKIKNLPKLT